MQARRSRVYEWLNIELSAFALLGLVIATMSWENHDISASGMFVVWAVAGPVLALALRAIYAERNRRSAIHR